MTITAAMVKELREKTGAGFMDSKKALEQCEGDMEKAMEFLRQKGIASADKKQNRIAAEGVVATYIENGVGAIVEVNCETDFVAKNEDFKSFVNGLAKHIATTKPADMDALNASVCACCNMKIEDAVKDAITNIVVQWTEGKADTEVDVDYKIYIEDVKVEYVGEARKDENGVEVAAAIPTNMKFYDSKNQPITHANMKAGTEIASGRVLVNAGKSDVTTALTWEWPYETGDKLEGSSDLNAGDAQDTLDGQYPVKITITYKVDAWQVEPSK